MQLLENFKTGYSCFIIIERKKRDSQTDGPFRGNMNATVIFTVTYIAKETRLTHTLFFRTFCYKN